MLLFMVVDDADGEAYCIPCYRLGDFSLFHNYCNFCITVMEWNNFHCNNDIIININIVPASYHNLLVNITLNYKECWLLIFINH